MPVDTGPFASTDLPATRAAISVMSSPPHRTQTPKRAIWLVFRPHRRQYFRHPAQRPSSLLSSHTSGVRQPRQKRRLSASTAFSISDRRSRTRCAESLLIAAFSVRDFVVIRFLVGVIASPPIGKGQPAGAVKGAQTHGGSPRQAMSPKRMRWLAKNRWACARRDFCASRFGNEWLS